MWVFPSSKYDNIMISLFNEIEELFMNECIIWILNQITYSSINIKKQSFSIQGCYYIL